MTLAISVSSLIVRTPLLLLIAYSIRCFASTPTDTSTPLAHVDSGSSDDSSELSHIILSPESDSSSKVSAEKNDNKIVIDDVGGDKISNEADDDEDDEKSGGAVLVKSQFNFASHAAGAIVLDKSPASATGYSNLLNDDKDKYGISSCSERKWVVIGLSEDVLVTSVALANYEKYSSKVKDFQLLAATSYPTDDWIHLGKFEAQARLGEQYFNVSASSSSSAHTRYLKFKFMTHYDDEALCTLSQIKVHGTTVIASFKQEVERSDSLMRDMLSQFNSESPETINATSTADPESSDLSNQSLRSEEERSETGQGVKIEGRDNDNVSAQTVSVSGDINSTYIIETTEVYHAVSPESGNSVVANEYNSFIAAAENESSQDNNVSNRDTVCSSDDVIADGMNPEAASDTLIDPTTAAVALSSTPSTASDVIDSNTVKKSVGEDVSSEGRHSYHASTPLANDTDNNDADATTALALQVDTVVEKDNAGNSTTIDSILQSIFPKETTIGLGLGGLLAPLTTLVSTASVASTQGDSTVEVKEVAADDSHNNTVFSSRDDTLSTGSSISIIDSPPVVGETTVRTQNIDDGTSEGTVYDIEKEKNGSATISSEKVDTIDVNTPRAPSSSFDDNVVGDDTKAIIAPLNSDHHGNTNNSSSSSENQLSRSVESTRPINTSDVTESNNNNSNNNNNNTTSTFNEENTDAADTTGHRENIANSQQLIQIDDLFNSASALLKRLSGAGSKPISGFSSVHTHALVSDLSCLEMLKFSDFQSKMMAKLLNTSAGSSGTAGSGESGGGHAMTINTQDNVFRHLMQKIKALEMSYAIIELYNVQVNECYRSVIQELTNKTITALESSNAASVDASNSAVAANVLLKIIDAKNNEKSVHILNVFSLTEKEIINIIPFLCLIILCLVLFSIAVLAHLYIHVKPLRMSQDERLK